MLPRARGAPGAVHVGLRKGGRIVVDHRADAPPHPCRASARPTPPARARRRSAHPMSLALAADVHIDQSNQTWAPRSQQMHCSLTLRLGSRQRTGACCGVHRVQPAGVSMQCGPPGMRTAPLRALQGPRRRRTRPPGAQPLVAPPAAGRACMRCHSSAQHSKSLSLNTEAGVSLSAEQVSSQNSAL